LILGQLAPPIIFNISSMMVFFDVVFANKLH